MEKILEYLAHRKECQQMAERRRLAKGKGGHELP
jgi:hypothetical protein